MKEMLPVINGNTLRDAYLSGANHITNQKQRIDELNVFPVPDGDTGTNMSMTINNAVKELSRLENATVAQVSETAASAFLRGARGNSGVILSLLFRGFSKGLKGKQEMSAQDFVESLGLGVDAAYKAVMKPTEGTILTVARVAHEKAKACESEDFMTVFDVAFEGAKEALASTPELLPVLKKAGVVDAGGQGFVTVLEGMRSVFTGEGMILPANQPARPAVAEEYKNAAAETDAEITFTYCTEFIVNTDGSKDSKLLRAYLETIGDSAVVVDDETIIKVHVHTDHPGNAIEKALTFGYLTNLKIENMRDQHERAKHDNKERKEVNTDAAGSYSPVKKEKPFGFVSVCVGDGIEQLFYDLGADNLVSGGQTMNPSTDDILRAVELTPAETVFVLPNNKNIIMAAEMAVPLSTRNLIVLPTQTVPMGIAAMLAFDPDVSADENTIAMKNAAEKVSTGQITFAARDSDFDGFKIKEGDILAMDNGKLAFTEKDFMRAAVKLTRSMCKKDSAFVTLIYGESVSEEQAESVREVLENKLGPDVEVTAIRGGQPIYHFIISVE